MNTAPELRDLAQGLARLRADAGSPTYDAMVARAEQEGLTVVKSSLWTADKGTRLPGWRVTQAYVLGCKGDPNEWLTRWKAAHDATMVDTAARSTVPAPRRSPAASAVPPRPTPDLSAATTPAELRRLLRDLYHDTGGGSRRSAAAEAERSGLRLSRSAIQNILDADRDASLPRATTLIAFLTICGVPEADRRAWLAARDSIDRQRRPSQAQVRRPPTTRPWQNNRRQPPTRPARPAGAPGRTADPATPAPPRAPAPTAPAPNAPPTAGPAPEAPTAPAPDAPPTAGPAPEAPTAPAPDAPSTAGPAPEAPAPDPPPTTWTTTPTTSTTPGAAAEAGTPEPGTADSTTADSTAPVSTVPEPAPIEMRIPAPAPPIGTAPNAATTAATGVGTRPGAAPIGEAPATATPAAGVAPTRAAPAAVAPAAGAAPTGAAPAAGTQPAATGARTPTASTHRRHSAAAFVLAACLVLVGAVPSAAHATHERSRLQITTIPPMLHPQYPDAAPPAAPRLLALADRAAATVEPTPAGRYTYVRTQAWSLDTTATSNPEVHAAEEHLWWAADGSARQSFVALAGPPGAATAVRDKPASLAVRTVVDFPVGEFNLVVENPSADPARLAEQLNAHNPASNGPHATIEAVADMYKQQGLSPDQRAAVLRVLAGINGLRDRGTITDRADRPGIAISADNPDGTTRDLAIFDADTGELLSYERIVLIAPARSPVRAPTVTSYVLYLAHGRTDRID